MKSFKVLLVFSLLIYTTYIYAQHVSRDACPLDLEVKTVPTDSDLMIYLPLDGNTSNMGSGTNLIQYSGENNYLSTLNNSGLRFDGENDYIEVTPSLDLIGDFTITAWIKPYSQSKAMSIFSIRDQCYDSYRGFSMAMLDFLEYNVPGLNYQVNFHMDCSGYSAGDRYNNPEIDVPDNVESFIALIVHNNINENREVQLFVNCTEFSTVMTINYPTNTAFDPLLNYITTIGANSKVDGYFNSFNGIIDEFRLYNRALNDDEINNIYRSTIALGVSEEITNDCYADSAVLTLYNTESDVVYQLKDITSGQLISDPLSGNCGELRFYTGYVTVESTFKIIATRPATGCSIELSHFLTVTPSPKVTASETTDSICQGDSLFFVNKYIYSSGVYNEVETIGNCEHSKKLTLEVIPVPLVEFENDTLCLGQTKLLDVEFEHSTYIWQDNSMLSNYLVTEPGQYSVKVTNSCGEDSDTAYIAYNDCNCDFFIPNAFTPDADLLNDSFVILSECYLDDFHLMIFNRWGSKIFETYDINEKWDGYFNGILCPPEIYVWLFYYTNLEFGQTGKKSGSVMLVK